MDISFPNSTKFKDYAKVLGLLSQPTEEEVKRAFRRLALKYHPDKVLTREKSFAKHHSIFHIIIVSLIFLLISFFM